MRKLRHHKKKNFKRRINFKNKKKDQLRVKPLVLAKKRWINKKKTFSPYPYIITVSFYKRNVFFTLSNIKGQTKIWTSSGRLHFKGRDKTAYMAIIQVNQFFLKRIWRLGIRCAILKLKNVSRTRIAIKKSIRMMRKICPIKFVGLFIQMQIAFNGCRKKKKRRK
jgi:ribosomal protein S11